MSYNLKCCSFYPNNFGASALYVKRGSLSFYLRSIAVFSLQQLGELAVEGREEMLYLAAGILV